MSGQTPAGWFPDPQDESQVRYWDGNQWTSQQAPRAPQASMPGQAPQPGMTGQATTTVTAPAPPAAPYAAAAPGSAPKKNWFLRHKVLTGLFALVVVIVVAAATSSGGGSNGADKANDGNHHAAKTKSNSKSKTNSKSTTNSGTSKASNSGQSVQGSSAYGTVKMPLQNGDWRLDSIQVKNDGLGDFGGTARITYTGSDSSGGDNIFTVTVFKGKNVVATLNGGANTVKPGSTATVQFISSDKYVPGPYKYDFQNDL